MSTDKPATSGVRVLSVSEELAGQRIDNFLIRHLKGVPKTRVYRLLRKGEVRVNKGRVKPDHRLSAGDQVRIPPVRMSQPDPKTVPAHLRDGLDDWILYEDKQLIVLNKPSGIAVHGGSGISFGVIERLRAAREHSQDWELVHRLDRDTSGCLMVAKRRSMLRHLQQVQRDSGIGKEYLALVAGRWQGGAREVQAPLRKDLLRGGERLVRVAPDGKPSQTRLEPEEVFVDMSLLRARLRTGRTHQIRVHCAHIGHPLLGDDKYGDERAAQLAAGLGLKRLFLHAAQLDIPLPDGKSLRMEAPLPRELKQVLNRVRGHRYE